MVNLTAHARDNLDGVPATIVATLGMHGLCGFFLQSTHKFDKLANIIYYVNPTLS